MTRDTGIALLLFVLMTKAFALSRTFPALTLSMVTNTVVALDLVV